MKNLLICVMLIGSYFFIWRTTMARGDQLGRQWRIIQTLISSRMGKSAADLAEELECNPRTIYRDLEALQVAGFPIYTDRVKGKSLWSVLDTVKHQIPIPFSLPELMALYFGSDMMKVFLKQLIILRFPFSISLKNRRVNIPIVLVRSLKGRKYPIATSFARSCRSSAPSIDTSSRPRQRSHPPPCTFRPVSARGCWRAGSPMGRPRRPCPRKMPDCSVQPR